MEEKKKGEIEWRPQRFRLERMGFGRHCLSNKEGAQKSNALITVLVLKKKKHKREKKEVARTGAPTSGVGTRRSNSTNKNPSSKSPHPTKKKYK